MCVAASLVSAFVKVTVPAVAALAENAEVMGTATQAASKAAVATLANLLVFLIINAPFFHKNMIFMIFTFSFFYFIRAPWNDV